MADNYTEFSQHLPFIDQAEYQWLVAQQELVTAIGDGQDLTTYRLIGDPHQRGIPASSRAARQVELPLWLWEAEHDPGKHNDLLDADFGQDFAMELFMEQGEESLSGDAWINSDAGMANLGHVAYFVYQYLKQFPHHSPWSLTYASYCSKLRVGEQDGGALFITDKEIKWWNAYDFVAQCKRDLSVQDAAGHQEITITVAGGVVQDVDDIPDDVAVCIHDYDCEALVEDPADGIHQDRNGELFFRSVHWSEASLARAGLEERVELENEEE